MKGARKKIIFFCMFVLLITLYFATGCQNQSVALPGNGVYLIQENEYLLIPKVGNYKDITSFDQGSIPAISNNLPAIWISDSELDTNYLVLRSAEDGRSLRYSMDLKKDMAFINIEEPLTGNVYCLVMEDPFIDTFSAWCFEFTTDVVSQDEVFATKQLESETTIPGTKTSSTQAPDETPSSITPTLGEPTQAKKTDYSYDLVFASDVTGRFRIYKFNTETGESELQKIPDGSKDAYWSTFCGETILAEVVLDGNAGQVIAVLDPVKANAAYLPVPLAVKQSGVPRCNPEGDLLAYSAQESRQWGLYILNFETGETDRFYPPSNVASGYASWVLERNDLAFNVIDTSNANLIYILEDALSDPNYVKFGSGGNPSLSPDGSQLVYSCKAPNVNERVLCIESLHGSGAREELVVIYRRSAAGLKKNQIQPASMWSGDGEWIYYSSAEDGDWDIYRIHPDGTGLENLKSMVDGYPQCILTLRPDRKPGTHQQHQRSIFAIHG